ncbi:hypothetical protein BDZ91DRAFT_794092 [Kalaharituber pfeilii]|nr:hypothetical protein BDZ91DRAFT_794092 [Kalaharituber pfeilii]
MAFRSGLQLPAVDYSQWTTAFQQQTSAFWQRTIALQQRTMASRSGLQPVDYSFPAADYSFLAADNSFPAADYGFPAANYSFPAANYSFPVADYGFPAADYGFPHGLQLPAVDYSQWTTAFQQQTMAFRQRTTAFQVARFDAEGRWFTGTRTNPVEIQPGIDAFGEGIKALSSGMPLANAVHRRSRGTMGTQASDVENNTEEFYNDGSNLCEGLVT